MADWDEAIYCVLVEHDIQPRYVNASAHYTIRKLTQRNKPQE
jgi:hypothetical protein